MKNEEKKERRPYSKPELRRVQLTPEESLSIGCKTVSDGGSLQAVCNVPSWCFAEGS